MVTPARGGVRVEASWGTRRQGGWSRERGRGCVARAVFYIAAFAVIATPGLGFAPGSRTSEFARLRRVGLSA
eukprot:s3560_g2.t1